MPKKQRRDEILAKSTFTPIPIEGEISIAFKVIDCFFDFSFAVNYLDFIVDFDAKTY